MNISLTQSYSHWQFGRRLQSRLLTDLLLLLEEGVRLQQSIEVLGEIYDGVALIVVQEIADVIAKGQSLTTALAHWYPSTIVEMLRAGEKGGTLLNSLKACIEYYDTRIGIVSVLLQSLTYPSIVIILACIMLVVIKQSVLENFAVIRPVRLWPAPGQQLYDIANIIQYGWWAVLSFLAIIILAIRYFCINLVGPMRSRFDFLPLVSLYRRAVAARVMETIGLLLSNGMPIKNALSIIEQRAGPYLAWHLFHMQESLSHGQDNIAEVLNTQLLDREDFIRLRVMARGQNFDQALVRLGRLAMQRFRDNLAFSVRIMGGVLLAMGAMLAAMIVIGIYSVGSTITA